MKREVQIPVTGQDGETHEVAGNLEIPPSPKGLVVFSHGSGSSRLSPRNNYVAGVLRQAGFGTLLMDLLTPEEDEDRLKRFDIELLTERLITVTEWVFKQAWAENLPLGYFGASTGSASALRAASFFRNKIAAVVSRGGRPDLAFTKLPSVVCPVLLIVGGLDTVVIDLNEKAYLKINAEKDFRIVDGATHLFEEPGKLEEVAGLATDWFSTYLVKRKITI